MDTSKYYFLVNTKKLKELEMSSTASPNQKMV